MSLGLLLSSLFTILTWSDLGPAEPLVLRQEVRLGEHAFPAGARFSLLGREALELPGAPLVFFRLLEAPCERPGLKHELEIVVPEGNPEASAVGVELEGGCRWGVYVEQKDLLRPSLFAAEGGRREPAAK